MKYTFRNFLTGMVVAIAALYMSVPKTKMPTIRKIMCR